MRMIIDVPDYKVEKCIDVPFEDDAKITCKLSEYSEGAVISANAAGLKSLAIHLLEMSQKEVPVGSHIHYADWVPAVSYGSIEFIIEKTE